MNIGLIGCGRWGANILRDLRTLDCTVHVVARSMESLKRADKGRAQYVYPKIASLPPMDGLVVATPTSTHKDVVLEAARLQTCPIFVEKPLAASLADANAIREKAWERVFIMDKWRYHPGVELIRDAVRNKRYGRLIGLKTLRAQNGNPHPDIPAAWTYLPHDFAVVREILGQYPSIRHAVSDQGGNLVTIISGDKPWVVIEFSSRYFDKRREIRAYFELATVVLPSEKATSVEVMACDAPTAQVIPFSDEMPLFRELQEFVKYLNGGHEPKSNCADGVDAVGLIERSLTSCVSG
jgi:predicted dehydrogenase